MKPYTLGIFGHPVASLAVSCASSQMLTWGLVDGFARLPHAHALVFPWSAQAIPECLDVAVVHTYLENLPGLCERLRAARCGRIALFLEAGSTLVDRSFLYGYGPPSPTRQHIRLPCPKEELHPQPKTPGTVLFDHMWPTPAALETWRRCRDAAAPLRDRLRFWQIERATEPREERPEWVTPIPLAGFPTYLAATSDIETFVVTHQGSYNHSLIDMAARGTRIVCYADTVAPALAADLGAVVVRTDEEMRAALLASPDADSLAAAIDRMTDLLEVTCIIDRWIQEGL